MKTNRQSGPASWFTSLRGWQTLVTRRAGTALGTKAVKPKGYEPPYTLQESSQCCRTFVFGRCRGAVGPRGNTVQSTANQGPRAVAGPNPPGAPEHRYERQRWRASYQGGGRIVHRPGSGLRGISGHAAIASVETSDFVPTAFQSQFTYPPLQWDNSDESRQRPAAVA